MGVSGVGGAVVGWVGVGVRGGVGGGVCSCCVWLLRLLNITEPPSVTGNFGRVVAAGVGGVAYIKSIQDGVRRLVQRKIRCL